MVHIGAEDAEHALRELRQVCEGTLDGEFAGLVHAWNAQVARRDLVDRSLEDLRGGRCNEYVRRLDVVDRSRREPRY